MFLTKHMCLLLVNAMTLLLTYFEIRIIPEKLYLIRNDYAGCPLLENTKHFYNICTMLTNGEDVEPALYKCCKNVLCLLGISIHNKGHYRGVKMWPWCSGKCCLTVTSEIIGSSLALVWMFKKCFSSTQLGIQYCGESSWPWVACFLDCQGSNDYCKLCV